MSQRINQNNQKKKASLIKNGSKIGRKIGIKVLRKRKKKLLLLRKK